MRQFSCLQDRKLFVGVSFGDSDEDEDAAAAEAHSSRSDAALAQAAAVDAVAGAAATDSAATLAVPAPVASPAANPAANSAPAVQHLDGGSVAQLRQRATARWAQLLSLTSEERLQRALSPAAAEAAAEAEGLCLVRLPGTRSGLKICGSSCDPVLEAATLHATCTCTCTCTCTLCWRLQPYMHIHAHAHAHATCTCTCTCHMHMHMHPACNHTRSGFKNVTLLAGRHFTFAAYMADGNRKILIGYFMHAEEAALACAFATSNSTFLYSAATHARVAVCPTCAQTLARSGARRVTS